ncbi:MAG: hypothetical protein O2962_09220 [Cyanobacteria bacterium]|nr:hypothetical protein [Cyanobacteriota bacterium]
MKNLTWLQIGVALANIAVFGLMFTLMGYFELMGADQAYFDAGTIQNIKYINMMTEPLGLTIDPASQAKVTTVWYAACLGIALAFSGLSIMIANRRSDEFYEVTN